MRELVVDNFAGAGGASTGIEQATGRPIDYAINHNPLALDMHWQNHPHTEHLCENVFDVDPVKLCSGRPVGLAWFSPDCTHHSKAKGGKPRSKKVRGLAWVVLRWASAVRPRVIMLENVEEFQQWGPLDGCGMPLKSRKGETFEQWIGHLRNLGYQVEHRELVASDYGAPTTRKRFFLVARCDGQPIVWPEPTHGPGRAEPYRTAAECIDWGIECPSIFERKRPLVENTLRRIAVGLQRYVIEASEPYILTYYGPRKKDGCEFRGRGITEPLPTQTTENRFGLVVPTVCAIDNKSSGPGAVWGADSQLRTITTENRFALVNAFLTRHFGNSVGREMETPMPTVMAGGGGKTALTSVFLAKHYGGVVGHSVDRPIGTVTTVDHHSLVTAHLTGRDHTEDVQAFLIKYYGSGTASSHTKPLDTITTRGHFGLVKVHGKDYQIVDIGLRMLQPHELALAQGFPSDYVLLGTKTQKIAFIGNSVCPCLSRVLVSANYEAQRQEAV